jgi:DNA-binding response OmpR family regulator
MSAMRSYALLLEKDDAMRHSVAEMLRGEGFEVVEETESSAAVSRVMRRSPGIVIMAEEMPPLDDVELLPLLRRLTRAPIVVLGAGGEAAVVKALLQGADMYLKKPVNFREMLSRVRALIRRSERDFDSALSRKLACFTLEDIVPSSLKSSLTAVEVRLLTYLLENRWRVVSHQELIEAVWGGSFGGVYPFDKLRAGSEGSRRVRCGPAGNGRLRFYIYSLRRKLGRWVAVSLQTQSGVGYRLIPSLKTLAPDTQ